MRSFCTSSSRPCRAGRAGRTSARRLALAAPLPRGRRATAGRPRAPQTGHAQTHKLTHGRKQRSAHHRVRIGARRGYGAAPHASSTDRAAVTIPSHSACSDQCLTREPLRLLGQALRAGRGPAPEPARPDPATHNAVTRARSFPPLTCRIGPKLARCRRYRSEPSAQVTGTIEDRPESLRSPK